MKDNHIEYKTDNVIEFMFNLSIYQLIDDNIHLKKLNII